MLPNHPGAVYLRAYGQELPEAPYVSTKVLADKVPTNLGEAWEGVWVKTGPCAVVDTLGLAAYEEFRITSAAVPTAGDSLLVNPMQSLSYLAALGDVVKIWGLMEQFDGNFQIRPFEDQYMILTGASGVDNTPSIMPAGGFDSIYPTPFNPVTNIKFVVNRANLVQLNIYNIRGEKVRTLIQDSLPANVYTLTWDGTDDAGQGVASGNYFARLRIGAEVTQVRKMSLVK